MKKWHKIYIAAPLFDSMELARNTRAAARLEELGYEVFLPQRDSGEAFEGADRRCLFKSDLTGLCSSELVIAFLDGRVPDEGTCFEMGYAYATNIPIIVICSDRRSFMDGHMNVMLEESPITTCKTLHDAVEYMEKFSEEK